MTPFPRNGMPANAGSYMHQFPYRGGMPMLPAKPNPLATAKPPGVTPATAEGIQALKQALSNRPTPSESKTYKFEKNPMQFGQDAVDSLAPYLKQAGLNPFQTQFFSRLILTGLSQAQVHQAVKSAGDRFGLDVYEELAAGFQKLSADQPGFFRRNYNWARDGVENMAGRSIAKGMEYFNKNNPAAVNSGFQRLGEVLDNSQTAKSITDTAKSVTDTMKRAPEIASGAVQKNMPDFQGMFKQFAPYMMLSALGGGGGAALGGGGGAALGGLGLPLLMYLMMNQQGKSTPFDGLGSMMGNMFGMNNPAAPKPPGANPNTNAPPVPNPAAPAPTASAPPAPAPVSSPAAPVIKPPAVPAPTDYNPTPVNPEAQTVNRIPRPNFSPMKLPVSGRMMV